MVSRGKMLFMGNYAVGTPKQRDNGTARRGVANRDSRRGRGRGVPTYARARADGRAVARIEVQMVGGHLVLLGFYNAQSKQIQLDLNAPSKPAFPEMREGLKGLLDRFQALGKRLELEAFLVLDDKRRQRLEGEAALDKVTRDILESLRQQKEIRHTVNLDIRSSGNVATGNRVPASFTKRQRDDAARKMKKLNAETVKQEGKLYETVQKLQQAEADVVAAVESRQEQVQAAQEELDRIHLQQEMAFDEGEGHWDE